MSAKRGWSSCWRIGGEEEGPFRAALRCGIGTVWLTTEDDVTGSRWLEDPTARWILVSYTTHGDDGHAIAFEPVFVPYHVYGSPPEWASMAVEEAVRRLEDAIARALGPAVAYPILEPHGLGVPGLRAAVPESMPLVRAIAAILWGKRGVDQSWLRFVPRGGASERETFEALRTLVRATPGRGGPAALLRELGRSSPRLTDPFVAGDIVRLVAWRLLGRERLPPPDRIAERLSAIDEELRKAGAPLPTGGVAHLWEGEDRDVAVLRLVAEGADVPLPEIPTGERARRALERLAASDLPEPKRAAREALAGSPDSRIVAMLSLVERGPKEIAPEIAARHPDLAPILAHHGEHVPEDVRAAVEFAHFAANLRPGRADADILAKLKRRLGERGLLALLDRIARSGSDRTAEIAACVAGLIRGRAGACPSTVNPLPHLLAAGVVERATVLSSDDPDLSTLAVIGSSAIENVPPAILVHAALSRLGDPHTAARSELTRRITGEIARRPRSEIEKALEEVAHYGGRIGRIARRALAMIGPEGSRVDGPDDVAALAFLTRAGLGKDTRVRPGRVDLDVDTLRAVVEDIASHVDRVPGRVLEAIVRSLDFDTNFLEWAISHTLPDRLLCPIAKRAAELGLPQPRLVSLPDTQKAVWVACNRAAGGDAPEFAAGPVTPFVLARVLLAMEGRPTGIVGEWVAFFANRLRRAAENPVRLRWLVADLRERLSDRELSALERALPRDAARLLRSPESRGA